MLKILFEYLTDSYALLENPIHNYIIMGVVGLIAYFIAFGIVGWFYNEKMIRSSTAGSILHWTIRFIVFLVIYYTFATVIRIYNWIKSIPVHVWWIVLIIILVSIVMIVILKIIVGQKNKDFKEQLD